MDATATASASNYAANPADLPSGTLTKLFHGSTERNRSRSAFRYFNGAAWQDITYGEARRLAARVTGALKELDLERGERVAILSENRPEWALSDYGCLVAGVVDVPIYATLTPDQIAYILEDSGARLIFCSTPEQLAKVERIRSGLPELSHVVVFDSPETRPEGVLTWDEFLAKGDGWDGVADDAVFSEEVERAAPDQVATILYTSGTTGDPKGVMLTHDNLFSNIEATSRLLSMGTDDSTLSFLPLSHVFQRMVDYYLFGSGVLIAYARSIDTVAEDLRTIRPTIVVSVPRLYEKVHAKVTEAGGLKGQLVQWAKSVGERWADARLEGRTPDLSVRLQYPLANALVFKKLREGVGGRLKFFVSGGAPLSPEINKFFYSAGILILEGYGLTETSPVTNVNTPEALKIGTVGRPVPGTEIRIAEDGEILVRGRQVMKGYFNRPEATAEAITEDGWFHTGDIGELDAEGFLRITDRKKDLIVTAGGKNVAPQPIEGRLKENRFIDQPVLVGDRRKFLSLLVVPSFETLESWARDKGLSFSGRRELLEREEVHRLFENEVAREMKEYARVEVPKKIVLLDEEFTIEDGSLTPTQKVKRRVVEERLGEVIDSLYDEGRRDQTVFLPW